MDSSEQRRRRKPISKTSYKQCFLFLQSRLFSVRSFLLCFGFLSFLLLLSYTTRLNYSVFKPVLIVSNIPLVSSRSDFVQGFDKYMYIPSIQNRILLPDHILLLVNSGEFVDEIPELDCVYARKTRNYTIYTVNEGDIIKQKVISLDNYDDFRLIVRCPLPPENFSARVHLDYREEDAIHRSFVAENGLGLDLNQSVYSWENLAYEATLDDNNTIVVFVKGLNTRSGRESDPDQFSCHFQFRDLIATTKAIIVAQEVVRCFFPLSIIKKNTREGDEIRVAIGVSRARERLVLPSVARVLFNGRDDKKVKYDVCVCTMIWNQASMIREWIMYHAWLGVERWFIYDNNSDDGIKEIIDELNDYNVTRHVWPWIKTQEAGFSHCALRAKDECNWIAFMDVDEFFYFRTKSGHNGYRKSEKYARKNGLKALVSNYTSNSRIGEIRTNCYSFGPSSLTSPPPKGVLTGYTCRIQSPERHKSIIRPKALDTTLLNVVHHFRLRKGFKSLNLPMNIGVINHYKYQVWDVFKAKFYRRVATYVADWQENQKEGSRDRAPGLGTEAIEPANWSRQFCEVWDTGMHDFVLENLANKSSGFLPWERSLNQ